MSDNVVISNLDSALKLLQGVEPIIQEARKRVRKAEKVAVNGKDSVGKIALDLRTIYYDLISINRELGVTLVGAERETENENEEAIERI